MLLVQVDEGRETLEQIFVAAFPGPLLYAINCSDILERFQRANKDRYIIKIQKPQNRKEQSFLFTFTKSFINEAYRGYAKKGKEQLERAESIKEIFERTYEARLHHLGLLHVKVRFPDTWDKDKVALGETEASFQFYHIAKTLFNTIEGSEKMRYVEFKKLYTYLGPDGVSGLARKLALNLKSNFIENIGDTNLQLQVFHENLGNTRFFPLSVLGKHKAFNILMTHNDLMVRRYRIEIQRDFAFLFERLCNVEKDMFMPLGMANEVLGIYQKFSDGLDTIKDMFSFQLGISSTFYEVIGLTLALSTLVYGMFSFMISLLLIPLIALIFLAELAMLVRYSIGSMVDEELSYLIKESDIYET